MGRTVLVPDIKWVNVGRSTFNIMDFKIKSGASLVEISGHTK